MKIKGFVVLFALTLLIFSILPFLSAVEFNLKENFSSGETMITRVSGNFLVPPSQNNVFFYKGHVRIPMDWGMAKINNDYYIYALLEGKQEGEYSISIENVKYMKGSETITGNIVKNFTITNATAPFSLKPGVIASSGDFSLELQNLKDNEISVSVRTQITNASERDIFITTQDATAKAVSVSLSSGEIGKIYFKSGDGFSTFQTIELSSGNLTYIVPVYIFSSSFSSEASYSLEPSELISSIPTNSIMKKTIFIYNTGNKEIKNISLSLSDLIAPFVNLSQDYIDTLEPNANFPIELSFFSAGEIEVSGTLKANINGQVMLYSQISLKFLSNYVPANETQESSVKTCSELGGKICTSTEKCDNEIVYAKDNVCCLGSCVSTEKKSSAGVWIAIAIIFVIVVAGFWFYKKRYKKAGKPINLLDIAKRK